MNTILCLLVPNALAIDTMAQKVQVPTIKMSLKMFWKKGVYMLMMIQFLINYVDGNFQHF